MTPPRPLSVAVLGTGIMGSAMARNAARADLDVCAWSRPLADAQRLAVEGIRVAATPAQAVIDAQLVVTMVPDAEAIESFATGSNGFLGAMAETAVWIQTSTVGVAPAARLTALAAEHGVRLVDAPVLGSKEPAERAELVMLASGDDDAISACEPFFAAVSRKTLRLGSAGHGSAMKMVTNSWIMSAVSAVAESMALAEALDLDGRLFLDAIGGTPMDMGYAQTKGAMMAERRYPVQMTLAHGAKDARLAVEAARGAGLPARVASAAADLMRTAVEDGRADDDMAAAFHAATAPRPRPSEAPAP
jgi:3-hydroxyisobutyrate dehydrogenase